MSLGRRETFIPTTMAEWEAYPSTKLNAMVKLLLWHLEEDNRAPLRVSEDPQTHELTNELEPVPEWVPQIRPAHSSPDRIIVFVAFPSNNYLVTAVLDLFGIQYIEVNGNKGTPARAVALETFKRSVRNGPRVLLLSGVGATGLNITEANITIALVSIPLTVSFKCMG